MLGLIVNEVLQLAGISAFAISGALVGVRRGLDLLGILVVGSATGIGGGIIRDLLLGVHPPASFTHWPYLVTAVTASLAVFFIHPGLARIRHFEVMFDAFGLGLFAAGAFWVGATPSIATTIGGAGAIALRLISVARGWHLPKPRMRAGD